LKEHDITSKCRAGEYGIRTLPERWHDLIDEAIRIKRCKPIASHRPFRERLHELVELLRYIHLVANETKELHDGDLY
jgi:hypothetical protein